MKRSLTIISLLLCSVFMLTGCEESFEENDTNLSVYEFHQYDSDFNHTEEIIIKYDEEGNIVYGEAYWTFDKVNENASCESVYIRFDESNDAKYKDVKVECNLSSEGKTIKYTLTGESIKDGYLQNEDEYYKSYFYGGYEVFSDEETFKKYLEEKVIYLRDNDLFKDKRNYIVIDGKRIDS